jgi:hypothetical protein
MAIWRSVSTHDAVHFRSQALHPPAEHPTSAIGGSTMARYFFQANYRGVTVVDEIGEDFPTVQEAEAHASAVAKELSHNNHQPATVLVLRPRGGATPEHRAEE